MKIPNKGLYKVPGCSLYVRVLKLRYTDGIKAKYKLSFEYKTGSVCEVNSYTVQLKNIQHWERVQ